MACLDELGVVSKQRTNRHGRISGGASFSRGALYNMLRNPIYVGTVRHKEDLHEGLHEAIIDDATWQFVLSQLADHGGKKIGAVRQSAKRPLDGVLFESKGQSMRTTYASKSERGEGTRRTKRYWYYTSALSGSGDKLGVERLPADEIERVILTGLMERLADRSWLADQIKGQARVASKVGDILRSIDRCLSETDKNDDTAWEQTFSGLIERIDAQKDHLRISANLSVIAEPDADNNPILAVFDVQFQKRQNGRAKPIVIAANEAPQQDPDLIAMVADAKRWTRELLEEKASSVQQITEREGLRSGAVRRILPLAWLAPDISFEIRNGRQPQHLTAKTLRTLPELPTDWVKQRQILGFAPL